MKLKINFRLHELRSCTFYERIGFKKYNPVLFFNTYSFLESCHLISNIHFTTSKKGDLYLKNLQSCQCVLFLISGRGIHCPGGEVCKNISLFPMHLKEIISNIFWNDYFQKNSRTLFLLKGEGSRLWFSNEIKTRNSFSWTF